MLLTISLWIRRYIIWLRDRKLWGFNTREAFHFFYSTLQTNIFKTYSLLYDNRPKDLPPFCRLFHSEGYVQLHLLINSWTYTKRAIHFQLFGCTRDEGTTKQIMIHKFAKDKNGSFGKVIQYSRLLENIASHDRKFWLLFCISRRISTILHLKECHMFERYLRKTD